MNVLAIYGSPRSKGNSTLLLDELIKAASGSNLKIDKVNANNLNLEFCRGCLRCNVIRRCAIEDDDWADLSKKIMAAGTIIFASPIYFHHVSAAIKKIIDRFRSFIKVQITETGLIHTPFHIWQKHFILILTQGSPDPRDSRPVIDLFRFMTQTLGKGNRLTPIIGTGLAISSQVHMDLDELHDLYEKLKIPQSRAVSDFKHNQQILSECRKLGQDL